MLGSRLIIRARCSVLANFSDPGSELATTASRDARDALRAIAPGCRKRGSTEADHACNSD
eukprot:1188186-Prorocentrum_minimum.AAC.2